MARGADTDPGAPPGELLSVGRMAAAIGLSPATLRVWERRYGKPVPKRLPSGHRRYPAASVPWLRRVAEGLARGHRPQELLRRSPDELERLLRGASSPEPALGTPWVPRLRGFDARGVVEELDRAAAETDLFATVRDRVAPLLAAVGRAWADGELDVRHEHAFSQALDDWLRARRRAIEPAVPAPDGAPRPALVLATLTGEEHALGLQMVALVCATEGLRAEVLGADTPPEEIVVAVRETRAAAVGLSVSLASGGPGTDRVIAGLRAALPAEVELVVGGAGARGARRGPRGVTYLDDLHRLRAWLRGRERRAGARRR